MSYQGLSELHFEASGQTVTTDYYVEEVPKKTATSTLQRKEQKGPPTAVKLLPRMSEAIFQQDGVPAHNAARLGCGAGVTSRGSGRRACGRAIALTCLP